MKNKTAYYTTKGLIERYETPLKKNEADLHLQSQGQQGQEANQVHDKVQDRVHQEGVQEGVNGMDRMKNSSFETPNMQVRKSISSISYKKISKILDSSSVGVLMSPSRSWVDRILDKVIGESGQFSKYALICEFCLTHNGLVLPENFVKQSFKCMGCGQVNLSQEEKVKKITASPVIRHEAEISSPIRNNINTDKSLVLEDLESLKTENSLNSKEKVNGNHSSPSLTPTSSVEKLKKKSSSKLKKRIKR